MAQCGPIGASVSVCLMLATKIIKAADLCTSNQQAARCLKERVQVLVPFLELLEQRLRSRWALRESRLAFMALLKSKSGQVALA